MLKLVLFNCYRLLTRTLTRMQLHIGRIPGLWKLHKKIYAIIKPRATFIVEETPGGTMKLDTSDIGVTPKILMFGEYERYLTVLFSKTIIPGSTIVDIGANVGYFTLIAAKRTDRSGVVYAFEPSQPAFAILEENVAMNNYRHVFCKNIALSDTNGMVTMYLDKDNLGMCSFSEHNVNNIQLISEVPSCTLDYFMSTSEEGYKVDVLKIDAEGAEGLILKGARSFLEQTSARIFLEFCVYAQKNIGSDPSKTLDLLMESGYHFSYIDDNARRVIPIKTGDILYRCDKEGTINLLCEKNIMLSNK